MVQIKRALLSVFEKEGIVELAKFLHARGVEVISSGGTAKALSEAGIPVIEVSSLTGFPEMMEGRVKTLHPKIHGGILADRRKKEHVEEAQKHGIGLIDLVVVNLYPFEKVVGEGKPHDEIIEMVDIGGPTLVRAAAKNYGSVAVVVRPQRYASIMEEMGKGGKIGEKTREELALEAFEHISHYDIVIEGYLRKAFGLGGDFPEVLNLSFNKIQDLRYGENPHQKAAFYKDPKFFQPCVAGAEQLQGKQLSYNNILDTNSAFELVKEFEEPTAVVVKHNNPCGVASHEDIAEAYRMAKSVDPEAAFGGVIAVNTEVTLKLAKEITSTFVEVVVAPSYSKEALAEFKGKKNLRVMEVRDGNVKRQPYREYRSVVGGLLVQDANVKLLDGEPKVVTKVAPTPEEMESLIYAWKIAKCVKSNAIVYARGKRAVGIGAGQMKRVDAAKLAAMIAKSFGEELQGVAMASDAFFPFRDGVDFAASLGVRAIIQPGGSIRDNEVIAAADGHGIAMVFTGVRHFRH